MNLFFSRFQRAVRKPLNRAAFRQLTPPWQVLSRFAGDLGNAQCLNDLPQVDAVQLCVSPSRSFPYRPLFIYNTKP